MLREMGLELDSGPTLAGFLFGIWPEVESCLGTELDRISNDSRFKFF